MYFDSVQCIILGKKWWFVDDYVKFFFKGL